MRRSFAAFIALFATALPVSAQTQGYYRQPAIHGNTIVFVAEGDLWRTDANGGVASRLTTNPALESDPHISPDAAKYQLNRVARARAMTPQQVQTLVDRATEGRTIGLLGEPRVNVLRLNLMLDHPELHAMRAGASGAPISHR